MENKKVGFVLYENYYQKKDIASSRIRGRWLINYWPEAEEFVQGKEYDAVIYQKCYWKEHARAYDGIKILDICDPDWLDGYPVKEFMELMDAITVPTETLKEAIETFTDVPVFVVKDRLDLNTLPEPKVHTKEQATHCVWFGYAHNMEVLEPAYFLIKKLGLILKLVSNSQYRTSECETENITWTADTSNYEIQQADFALLPRPNNKRNPYKSENKEVLAIALGLPVAKDAEAMKRFMDPEERVKEMALRYPEVIREYRVEKSVEEMKDIIYKISENLL